MVISGEISSGAPGYPPMIGDWQEPDTNQTVPDSPYLERPNAYFRPVSGSGC